MRPPDNSAEFLKKAGMKNGDIEAAWDITRKATHRHVAMNVSIYGCDACDRRQTCAGFPVIGSGYTKSDIMIVTDVPTSDENGLGVGFFGPEGQMLRFLLDRAGINVDRVYFTHALRCYAPHEPTAQETDACAKHLRNEIAVVDPKYIIAFGAEAWHSVSSHDTNYTIGTPKEINGRSVMPTYNLSGIFTLSGEAQTKRKNEIWETLRYISKMTKEN